MVLDRLASWGEHHEKTALPTNIIYYRDGVSAGHYKAVQDQELNAIEEAYRSARKSRGLGDQKLNLTAVVVTKRHHTRFYPQKPHQGDRYGNGNTHPGTCVDQPVTSPYYQDFFLQSHSGIKGTARPTHYFVLKNDIPGMDLTALRDLVSPRT
jgi:eukaryotic translation initiation factor 2C